MPGSVDLHQLAARLADRRTGRTEANVQSDLHLLLTAADLDLGESDLDEIVLESPAGARRRIDVEVGFTVFEVKRDLRVGNVRPDAIEQLAGYVRSRTTTLSQRYVGVLTDGAEWHLHHLVGETLHLVSSFCLDPTSPDVEALVSWLEGVLATTEKITPTPTEIATRLGADSPSHLLDFASLAALYDANRNAPGVALKRELWTKLLRTAFGEHFTGDDALFIEHTLLVATAEIIAHAVIGFDPTDPTITPATLLGGQLFADIGIGGVVESDFFDWPVEVDGGGPWVRSLARRLARFTWGHVEHDVLKVLYESVIAATTRHDLGEYYTPDWLAAAVVQRAITDPENQKVLDPACGSGTFLFHAVRAHIAAAHAGGASNAEAITSATAHVIGMDVHPVAVTFARVTYLLAIGRDRLAADDRPALSVPVYLGDSVQWGQSQDLFASTDALTVPTSEGLSLFAGELVFPHRLLDDASRFDQLVAELAHRAVDRPTGSAPPNLGGIFRRLGVHEGDRATLATTFAHMCELQDGGRNHIWGYYVRNLARPTWLAREANRVDVIIGNPPWLAYRYMTAAMKEDFKTMSAARGMWAGAAVATSQDLSALFTARAVELYLREGGTFAMVMPLSVLTRRQYAGFRTGKWTSKANQLGAAFEIPWDLNQVKPSFFPVPAAVVFGAKSPTPRALPAQGEQWSGRLRGRNLSLTAAREHLHIADAAPTASTGATSPWSSRFTQGAALVPRFLVMVNDAPAGPLGAGQGRRSITSARSTQEKMPWKTLPSMAHGVERQFIRRIHLGDTLLPYRMLTPRTAVIARDSAGLMSGTDERIDNYPGLAHWTREAEAVWMKHRTKASTITLPQQLDYRHKLSDQFPTAPHRVLYTKSGMYLAAAHLADPAALVDQTLYWAAVAGPEEARFLIAILNSDTLLQAVRPLQGIGGFGPRDFARTMFQLPIPLFDPHDEHHQDLVDLAQQAETIAADVDVTACDSFQTQRRRVRQALQTSDVGAQLEQTVTALLT